MILKDYVVGEIIEETKNKTESMTMSNISKTFLDRVCEYVEQGIDVKIHMERKNRDTIYVLEFNR